MSGKDQRRTGESFIGAKPRWSSRGCQWASAARSLKPQWNGPVRAPAATIPVVILLLQQLLAPVLSRWRRQLVYAAAMALTASLSPALTRRTAKVAVAVRPAS